MATTVTFSVPMKSGIMLTFGTFDTGWTLEFDDGAHPGQHSFRLAHPRERHVRVRVTGPKEHHRRDAPTARASARAAP